MKLTQYLSFLLIALPLTFTACGGDDDDDNSSNGTTLNANANTTEKSQYATRMEMPKLHKGNNYLLLVKTTADIGVNYTVEWDCMKRAQWWSCWEWNSTNSSKGWDRNRWEAGETFNGYGGKGDPFQPDTEIPADYRTDLSDYSNSGYNRGHMCASEDRICSKEVNGQTFYLSNMHPQISQHNSGIWSSLESKVRTWRDLTVNASGTMYICKGGTISDVTIDGKTQTGVETYLWDRIPVPKYFWMAILKKSAAGVYSAVAIWTEHKAYQSSEYRDFSTFMISINELEQRTGLDFFCNLPDNVEETVEASFTASEWK